MQATALSKSQVLIMAIAAGASAANIYYNQPILKEIASSLHVNETQAGSISMLSQIGYGIGLFFLIPLGDKINKKKLILVLLFDVDGAPCIDDLIKYHSTNLDIERCHRCAFCVCASDLAHGSKH